MNGSDFMEDFADQVFVGNPWIRLSMAIENNNLDAIQDLIEPCRAFEFIHPNVGRVVPTVPGNPPYDPDALREDICYKQARDDLCNWGTAQACVLICNSHLFNTEDIMNSALSFGKPQLFMYALSLMGEDYVLPFDDKLPLIMSMNQARQGFPILYSLMLHPKYKDLIYSKRDDIIQIVDNFPTMDSNDVSNIVIKKFVHVLNTLTMEYAIEALGT